MGRAVVLGDLQTSWPRFRAFLDGNGLIRSDGRLRSDATVLAVGDYFDFHDRDGEGIRAVGRHGERILTWLAGHPPSQVRLLLGNHDVCRVDELHGVSDARFARAREAGDAIERLEGDERNAAVQSFHQTFPEIPTPGLASRDFRAFHTAQRALVRSLLLRGRLGLAAVVRVGARPALVTHAGVTRRELEVLGLPGCRDPEIIADALEAWLARAVDQVRDAWSRGEDARLDLRPLHFGGSTGEEGGGLLYHRPSVRQGQWHRHRHRRFHPRALPAGLLQVAGHTTHGKCLLELGLSEPVLPPGRTRVLVSRGPEDFVYGATGAVPHGRDDAVLHLVDGGIHHPRLDPANQQVLEVAYTQ